MEFIVTNVSRTPVEAPAMASSTISPQTSLKQPCLNTTQGVSTEEDSSPDAFVYIVVVLSFYALAMTILMVKYIRRENQEAQLSYYFHEFINREKFHTPRYQNKQGVTAIKRTLNKFYQSVGLVEADKRSPLHDIVIREEDAQSVVRVDYDTCMYSDSGVGSLSSHHRGSTSIAMDDDEEEEEALERDDVTGSKPDRALLTQEGSTIIPKQCGEPLVNSLCVRESAV